MTHYFEEYQQLYYADPSSKVFAQLAAELVLRGEIEPAIDICRKGLIHHPAYSPGRLVLSRALKESGKVKEAFDELKQVIKVDPTNISAFEALALIYEQVGQSDHAKSCWRKVIELDPFHAVGIQHLSDGTRQTVSQEAESVESIQKSPIGPVSLLPPRPDERSPGVVSAALADLFLQQGHREKAIDVLRQVLAANPQNQLVQSKLNQLLSETEHQAKSGRLEQLLATIAQRKRR